MSKNRKIRNMKRPGPLFTKVSARKGSKDVTFHSMDQDQKNMKRRELKTPLAKSLKRDQCLTVITGEKRVDEFDTESSDQNDSSCESEGMEEKVHSEKKEVKMIDDISEYKSASKSRHKPLYLNNEGGEKTLYCYYCKEYFNRTPEHPKNFINHIKQIHADTNADGTFTCKHCYHITKDKIALRRHFNTHRILDNPKVCQHCGETFSNFRDWRSHCKKHQKVKKSFGCYLCGNNYTSKPTLVLHLMSIHEQIGRKCKYCNKCILFELWDEHEKMEKELNKEPIVVVCEICAQTFTSKESAANHRRNFHSNKPEVYCKECGKTFRTTTNLAQHRTNTHAEKRFECRYCGYRSSYKYLVHMHIKRRHPLVVVEGMPDNAVTEHEPGTTGPNISRRKQFAKEKVHTSAIIITEI